VIAIVSHAWLLDDDPATRADAYARITAEFEAVHATIAGYRGRRLLHGSDDPRHVVNIRFFDRADDYDQLVAHPDYATWIARLSEHIEPRDPQKEILSVLLSTDR